MNWTEKQHGNIKLVHYKKLEHVSLMLRGVGKVLMTYKEFEDLREVMKEVDNNLV